MIWVINLDRREDRLRSAKKWFEGSQLEFIRQPAVDARSLDTRTLAYQAVGNLSEAEVACGMSHRKALEQFLASGLEVGLIFEDDFLETASAKKIACWTTFLASLAGEMDACKLAIVQMGYLEKSRAFFSIDSLAAILRLGTPSSLGLISRRSLGSFRLLRSDLRSGAHAYAVTIEGAKLLLAKPDHLIPMDDWIVLIARTYPQKTARVYPSLFTQASRRKGHELDSDIS